MATYTNKATGETYNLGGVESLKKAWSLAAFVASRNGWNLSMFSYDVTIKITAQTRTTMKKATTYKPKNNSDELNPDYLFCTKATDLLVAIINGQIDAVELAKKELDNRGLDHKTGKWVGFKKN